MTIVSNADDHQDRTACTIWFLMIASKTTSRGTMTSVTS